MSLQTLTRKKQPFVTFCRMSASEKVCNFVPFDLSHWKKTPPQSKRVMNWPYLRPSMLRLTFELYAKKKALFFPLSSLPASFVPHPHFVRRLLVYCGQTLCPSLQPLPREMI